MYSATDLAYLAGLIDGEGTISCSITKNKKNILALNKQLSIFNTNIDLIIWIQKRFGGKVFSRTRSLNWKTEHQIKWSPEEASSILKLVMPYLVIKRRQAEILILLHDSKSNSVSSEVHSYRNNLCDEIKELNRRGKLSKDNT